MRFRSLSKWRDPDAQRGLVFFAQRFDELTFEYSLDSYKAPTASVPFLVREAIDQVELSSETGLGANSIKYLVDEMDQRVKSNPIVSNLTHIKFRSLVGHDFQDLNLLHRHLTVFSGELNPRAYCLTGFILLKEACEKHQKSRIDYLAKEISAVLDNMGVSRQHQNAVTLQHFFGSKRVEANDDLDEFFKLVFPHNHEFTTILKVTGPLRTIDPDIRKMMGVELVSKIPKKHEKHVNDAARRFFDNGIGETLVVITGVKAADPFSAFSKSKQRIENLYNLYGLFFHKLNYSIEHSGLAVQECCSKSGGFYSANFDLMQFVTDNRPKAAAEKLKKFLRRLELPSGDDAQKFFRTVESHGLCAGSKSPENQLLNIWTCFETITPPRPNSSIVSSVVNGVLPFLGLRYLRRIAKRTALDVYRWNGDIFKEIDMPEVISNSEKKSEQIFRLLVDRDAEDALNELLGRCANFELLRYRIFRLAEIFRSRQNLVAHLEGHLERVSWQLHRIYRARNEIIHSGKAPRFTKSLIINADDYFDQAFFTASEFLSSNNSQDSLAGAFHLAELTYADYLQKLKDLPDRPTAEDCKKILWLPKTPPQKADFFKDFGPDN